MKENSECKYSFLSALIGTTVPMVLYRFGFNGKENDNELYGANGSFQDYGMRMYDTRVARFISVDPLTKDYPELTPFQFATNTPIQAIDLDGLEAYYTNDGVFYGWGPIRGDNAPTMLVTCEKIKNKETSDVEYKYDLKSAKNLNISHGEFQQFAAFIYNEGPANDYEGNIKTANAILDREKQSINLSDRTDDSRLQRAMDGLAFFNDCHDCDLEINLNGQDINVSRMSYYRANPPDGAKIPGTKIPLSKVKAKYYQQYINTETRDRGSNKAMRIATKAALDVLSGENRTNKNYKGWKGNATNTSNVYEE